LRDSPLAVEDRTPLPVSDTNAHEEPTDVVLSITLSVAETLSSLIEKATISQEAAPEEAPPAAKTVVAPSRELKHKVPQTAPTAKFEQFSSHPWAPFFKPRVQIKECEYYHSDLDVRNYEKVTAAGYSGLHLHPSGEPLPKIPVSRKSGWAVGKFVEGAYQPGVLKARIIHLVMKDTRVSVAAELLLKDTTRFRSYMLSTPHRRMTVGTSLNSIEDSANPVLAMLENCRMASTFEPDTMSWLAARAGRRRRHIGAADPKRLNVALSRARNGMFVIGCLSSLKVIPLWKQIITWCRFNRVLAEMCFFEKTTPAAIKSESGLRKKGEM
uniref:AAA_12 domain-containing protein n=1 Tax=Heligmosomoides polygyrus TaxID=6339 RepID=A0A183GNP3_HELPZ